MISAADRLLEAAKALKRERVLKRHAGPLEKRMQAIFRKQKRLAAAGLQRFSSMFAEAMSATEVAVMLARAEAETAEEMRVAIQATSSKAFSSGIEASGVGSVISFNVAHPLAVGWLEEHAAEMVTKINETTRSTIAGLVTRATEEGWSYGKTAREITARYEEFAVGKPQHHIRSRAHLVAVTEAANGYEEGQRRSMGLLTDRGLSVEKAWETVGDDLVSDGCMENEGAGWIPIDDTFPSGDAHPPRFSG